MQDDPLRGTFVSTAFDARFCDYNIHRLLVVDTIKVYTAAAAQPDWDKIILIVNDPTYGGSGGEIGVISTHTFAVQIAQHEYGHSFADLADEYESPYPGFPSCSDLSGSSPCEANVTDQTNRSLIKWAYWIDPSTPIPTPEDDPQYDNLVGLFEGARFKTNDMYRSGKNCIMRSMGRPFCQVPGQAYILKLYQGGWGIPAIGIELIEPGSAQPTSPLTLVHPTSQVFRADVLSPVGGPLVSIEWFVNGFKVNGETSQTFTYVTSPVQSGQVMVEMRVQDVTSAVHPSMVGDELQTNYTWTFNVVVLADNLVFLPLIFR